MELKYDWNDEVILQFHSTLYLDEKSSNPAFVFQCQ
jgi:hypothetical protein